MRVLRRGSHTTMDEEGLLQDEEGLPHYHGRGGSPARRGGAPTLYTMDKKGLSHGYN